MNVTLILILSAILIITVLLAYYVYHKAKNTFAKNDVVLHVSPFPSVCGFFDNKRRPLRLYYYGIVSSTDNNTCYVLWYYIEARVEADNTVTFLTTREDNINNPGWTENYLGYSDAAPVLSSGFACEDVNIAAKFIPSNKVSVKEIKRVEDTSQIPTYEGQIPLYKTQF